MAKESGVEGALSEDEVWRGVLRRLVPWTIRRHRVTLADAEEMVQEGIAQLIEASSAIDLHDFGGLLRAVGSRINGVAVNRRRKKALRAVTLMPEGSTDERVAGDDDVEERIVNDDTARKAVSALLERLADDEIALSVVMLILEDVSEPAAQARALGREIHEIYNARRRLDGHVKAVQKLMESW